MQRQGYKSEITIPPRYPRSPVPTPSPRDKRPTVAVPRAPEVEVGLKVSLHDFASPKRCREFKNLDRPIFISCKTLYGYLIDAEVLVEAQSSPDSPRPNLRKRRRTPDDIRLDDEKRTMEAETREAKRRDAHNIPTG
jgi:hypothetical protein